MAGKKDWRVVLVTARGEKGIADPRTFIVSAAGAMDATVKATLFQAINDAAKAWLVEAQTGLVAYDAKSATCTVRCVRGGGCSRHRCC